MTNLVNKLKKNATLRKILKKTNVNTIVSENITEILLLTNRDSDNLGDQVIEACDIALITAVMKNLNIPSYKYRIRSSEASIINQKYMKTQDEAYLKTALKLIQSADLIVIGGAPMFNYKYQDFYKRTAVTIELAEKYNKPIIFSAIGIETYEEEDKKCQYLKERLNQSPVKQITTRDDFDALQKYIYNPQINIKKVADPAVFSENVFSPFCAKKKKKKTIGIFILRANGFRSNKVDFTYADSIQLWTDLIQKLKAANYDYELITSGHFGDEAFIDYMVREGHVPFGKCVFNMNTPEKMIKKISSYRAVISCRLHPSIISYALKVPSLGVVWNTKVKGFYDNIGYGDRIISTDHIDTDAIVSKIDQIIEDGVHLDSDYQMTVYETLFNGIKNSLFPESTEEPYTYEQLTQNIEPYAGTSEAELDNKLRRKFRRAYKEYNHLYMKKLKK